MKILFANRHIDPVGGVEHYIGSLAARLKDKGHEVSIIHADEGMDSGPFNARYRVPSLWEDELSMNRAGIKAMDDVLNAERPDVIYLHNLENGRAISYLSGKAVTIRYVHGYKTVDPDGKMLLYNPLEVNTNPLSPACFLRAYTRGSMPKNPVKGIKAYLRVRGALGATRRLGKVVVASGFMRDILCRNGINSLNMEILPYFVDYDAGPDAGSSSGGHILFSGRLAEGKGLDVLLEALKDVKSDFVLDVAGTGPLESFYRAKAQKLGLEEKVVFHGWIGHGELAELYKRSLFLVVPSVWPEPFGICGIEAAYFGKPAVAFDVGGISDWLIDGETGFLVKPYDKQEMASRIGHLLNNPDMARGLGARARELALQKYNPEDHIEKLLKIFASS